MWKEYAGNSTEYFLYVSTIRLKFDQSNKLPPVTEVYSLAFHMQSEMSGNYGLNSL